MKPIWAVGLVTLSRSMNGATGRPSDFSLSLCSETPVTILHMLSERSYGKTISRQVLMQLILNTKPTISFLPSNQLNFDLNQNWLTHNNPNIIGVES